MYTWIYGMETFKRRLTMEYMYSCEMDRLPCKQCKTGQEKKKMGEYIYP